MKDLQLEQKCKKSYQTVDSDMREQILIMLREQHIKPSEQKSRNQSFNHQSYSSNIQERRKEKKEGKKRQESENKTTICYNFNRWKLLASSSEELVDIVPFTEEISNDKVLAKLKAELIQKKELVLEEIVDVEAKKEIKKGIRKFKDINWLDVNIPKTSNKISVIQLAKLLKSNIEKKVEPHTLINLQTLAPLSMMEQIQIQMDVVQQQILMMAKK